MSRDATWNIGEIIRATSVEAKSKSTITLMQFQVMFPWVSRAPLGCPVVPEV